MENVISKFNNESKYKLIFDRKYKDSSQRDDPSALPSHAKVSDGKLLKITGLKILKAFRFENQKPAKTKKQALYFCLLFDLFVIATGFNFLCNRTLQYKIQLLSQLVLLFLVHLKGYAFIAHMKKKKSIVF